MPRESDYSSHDLTRTMLGVVCIGALIASTVWIVLPFVTAFLWASTIVISTWPVMLRLQAKLGGRRGLATTVMTLALLLVFLVPVSVSAAVLISNVKRIGMQVSSVSEIKIPPPPAWIQRIPVQGPKLAAEWTQAAEEGPTSIKTKLAPHAGRIIEWCVGRIGGIGAMLVQFLLTLIISAVLYMKGETAAGGVRRFARRIAGQNGDRAAILAAGTVRGVAIGVVVTAIIQATIAGAGLFLASVPAAGLLTAGAFLCCLAQIGPGLIMAPAVIWKFYSGDAVWGTVLLVFALVAATIDNFIRPVLIRKGANLPILLIIAGVIGGMLSFGIMGVFVGPVILAVTYVLLGEWIGERPEAPVESVAANSVSAASV
jgi:predicted PurR-regulated permease PerM